MSDETARPDDQPQLRIDPAHGPLASNQPEPATAPAEASLAAAQPLVEISQVRTQASQLATHLKSMQDDIDRREASLNAQAAEADNGMRAARLWVQQKQHDLDERLEQLVRREEAVAALEEMLEQLTDGGGLTESNGGEISTKIEEAMTRLRAQRREQEAEISRQRKQIDLRRQASMTLVQQLLRGVDRRRAAVEDEHRRKQTELKQVQQKVFQEDYGQAVSELEQRQKYVEDAEALLVNSQADLEVQREQVKLQRQRSEAELRQQRQELARQQHQLESEWQQRQEALARRSQQLDSRQAAIEQTRRQVAETHREALEVRLATEELWAKLSEVMPAAAQTSELARIRRKLAESYCLERNAAVEQRQQLAASQKRLAEQYIKLNAEKKELHDWIASRQQDIEQQAARLVAREQQLDRQQSEIQQSSDELAGQRRKYQARVRELVAELRRQKTTASRNRLQAVGV